jgi:hypothetical protein
MRGACPRARRSAEFLGAVEWRGWKTAGKVQEGLQGMERGRAGSQDWPWPDELDAVTAAGKYHKVLFENERVRVLEVRIARGQTVPIHTHRWPSALYTDSWSDFVRRDEKGNVTFDSRNAGLHQTREPRSGWRLCRCTLWKTWGLRRSGSSVWNSRSRPPAADSCIRERGHAKGVLRKTARCGRIPSD